MTTATMSYGMRARERMPFAWDYVTLGLAAGLLLVGLIMVTSASMSIAARDLGNPFYFLERQFVFGFAGLLFAWVVTRVPTELWDRYGLALLCVGLLLLFLVLIPGIGATVNGARRWLRVGPVNFQVSELAKVLVLTWVCSYCVRKRNELETTLAGLAKPVGLLTVAAVLLLCEPDFGATTVLFATGFAVLFVAGARLRYVLLLVSAATLAFAVLALTSAYRLKRLTGFLHPWDDPFNGGFQLTQSLIAIGRGSWFGVGPGQQRAEAVLSARGAHRFRVRRAGRGIGPGGGARRHRPVHGAGVARLSDFAHGGPGRPAFPILPGAGLRRVAGIAGHGEHRRQHGRVAHQGPDPAAAELWPQQPAGLPELAGRGAADLSRSQMQLALGGDAHSRRCAMSGANLGGPVLIMAGGTGGHVFPALAVARVLRERGIDVVWLGVPGSMEARLVPANGFPIEWVRVRGIRGKGLKTWLLAPLRILTAVAQSLRVLKRVRPRSVLGAGGYVSGPGGIAAWLLRIPLLIHEQNAVAGMTNRWLAHVAGQVLEGFPQSFGPGGRARTIGNPVRADIAAVPAPGVRFAGRSGASRLLVFGGSQGAQRLNAVVPLALARVAPEHRPCVRHQTGERGARGRARCLPRRAGGSRGAALHRRHGRSPVLGGSGGLPRRRHDIAELQAAGVGAIFVPLAVATDDHQTKNAEVMVRSGAAQVIQESDLTPERLGAAISELVTDRARLLRMAEAARGSRIVDAAARLADLCMAAGAPA